MDKIKTGDRVQILDGPTLTIGMVGTTERLEGDKWKVLLSKERTNFGFNYCALVYEKDLKKIND